MPAKKRRRKNLLFFFSSFLCATYKCSTFIHTLQNLAYSQRQMHTVQTSRLSQAKTTKDTHSGKVLKNLPPHPQKYNYRTFGKKMFKVSTELKQQSIFMELYTTSTHTSASVMSYTITSAPSSQRLAHIQIN